jgi:ABC-type glutathione transport system ATPase component
VEAKGTQRGEFGEALLDICNLAVTYQSRNQIPIKALQGVSLRIRPGESIGILGESGSGKSTLGASILRLLPPNGFVTGGTIRFRGIDILQASDRTLQKIRGAQIGMVFQQPGMALNPHMRVYRQVADVIHAHRAWSRSRCFEEARQILESLLGGDCDHLWEAYPHQLSGGQQQRVSIAQAIACHPQLIVADEPTSSLDAVVAAGILKVFEDLRRTSSVSLIFITHNPAILPGITDRVLVLRRGELVEEGTLRELFRRPRPSYTSELLGVVGPARPQ